MKNELIIGKQTSSALTKNQLDFNKSMEQLAMLKERFQKDKKTADEQVQIMLRDYHGELPNLIALKYKRVKQLEAYYDRPNVTKAELKKIKFIILDECDDVLSLQELDEWVVLHDKFAGYSYHESKKEEAEFEIEMFREVFGELTGMDLPDHINSEEEIREYIRAEGEKEREKFKKKAEKRAKKKEAKKSDEQKEKEALAQAAEKESESKLLKSVREIYLALVKAFHPDVEPNEAEKLRKTEVMKKVVDAYKQNDLLTLLQLQLELERIDSDFLEKVSDDVLVHYNKVLKHQISNLKQEIEQLKADAVHVIYSNDFPDNNWTDIKAHVKEQVRYIKNAIFEMTSKTSDEVDPVTIKSFLKSFRIPKKNDMDFLDW